VFDEHGRNVGHIAQGGQALLRVNATQGVLNVRWGADADQACQFQYTVPEDKGRRNEDAQTHDFRHVEAVCVGGMVSTRE